MLCVLDGIVCLPWDVINHFHKYETLLKVSENLMMSRF